MDTVAGDEPRHEPVHEPVREFLDEVAARALAREIQRCPGWVAYVAQHHFVRMGGTRAWWVRAHHRRMRFEDMLPITSREEWVFARMRWLLT